MDLIIVRAIIAIGTFIGFIYWGLKYAIFDKNTDSLIVCLLMFIISEIFQKKTTEAIDEDLGK